MLAARNAVATAQSVCQCALLWPTSARTAVRIRELRSWAACAKAFRIRYLGTNQVSRYLFFRCLRFHNNILEACERMLRGCEDFVCFFFFLLSISCGLSNIITYTYNWKHTIRHGARTITMLFSSENTTTIDYTLYVWSYTVNNNKNDGKRERESKEKELQRTLGIKLPKQEPQI